MSYLAERHGENTPWISSSEIGRERKIPISLAAKLLSQMATAGLAIGATGPGGGYRLAKPPEQITLSDIVRIFERETNEGPCPFGPGWCGVGEPCPLHNEFVKLQQHGHQFLDNTTLAVFKDAASG